MKVVVISIKNNNIKYSGTLVSWGNGKVKVDINGKEGKEGKEGIKTFKMEKWIVNIQ